MFSVGKCGFDLKLIAGDSFTGLEQFEIKIRAALNQFLEMSFAEGYFKMPFGIGLGIADKIVEKQVLVPGLNVNAFDSLAGMIDYATRDTKFFIFHFCLPINSEDLFAYYIEMIVNEIHPSCIHPGISERASSRIVC
ncbi:MAG: hypothetical protein R6U13_15045 [Desulfatiglandaceae bacterium]